MTTSMPSGKAHRVHLLPTTSIGWWALGLGGTSMLLLFAAPLINLIPGEAGNTAMFATYLSAFAAGVVGGIAALIAIIRRRERAVTVFLAAMPLAMYVVLIVIEVTTGGEH